MFVLCKRIYDKQVVFRISEQFIKRRPLFLVYGDRWESPVIYGYVFYAVGIILGSLKECVSGYS